MTTSSISAVDGNARVDGALPPTTEYGTLVWIIDCVQAGGSAGMPAGDQGGSPVKSNINPTTAVIIVVVVIAIIAVIGFKVVGGGDKPDAPTNDEPPMGPEGAPDMEKSTENTGSTGDSTDPPIN